MLSWFFKKRGVDAPNVATPPPPAAPSPAEPRARKAQPARQAEQAKVEWLPRLQAAQGDDAALLQLAQDAPVLEIKLTAIDALVTEEALKRAERAFRSRERKVHQAAKRRLVAAVARRENRAKAQALIASANALATEPVLAANRLVALDRDWQALDADLLEPGQHTAFAELRDRLNGLLRERGELEHRLQRWTLDATLALAQLRAACVEAAATGVALDTAASCEAARVLRAARPDVPATAALDQALEETLHTADMVEARLAWLQAPAPLVVESEPETQTETETETPDPAPTACAASAAQRWQDLPPLLDAGLTRTLNQRFEQSRQALAPPPAPAPAPPAAAPKRAARMAPQAANAEQQQGLDALLQTAETAIAEGQLAGMQQHLNGLDAALAALHGAALGDALQTRLQALQDERARLKGWQQWGGARARDELTAEAEALAQLTLAATGTRATAMAEPADSSPQGTARPSEVPSLPLGEADASRRPPEGNSAAIAPAQPQVQPQPQPQPQPQTQTQTQAQAQAQASAGVDAQARIEPSATASAMASAPAPHGRTPKLHLKTHADAINTLRARWKELDRMGAPAAQPLWQRFDAALHTAWQPVAAQQSAQKAARRENLAAREALLSALDAVPVQAPDTPSADDLAAHWKEQARALERFQLAWRQLGPLEHSVPSAARGALQQRLRTSLDRVEAPLRGARDAAHGAREQLIGRAEALVQELGRAPPTRDATLRVRELQAEWQQQARTVPLARAAEGALWARFKAATDAVFAQREAALNARDAELAANLAARQALVQRLLEVDGNTPEADTRRSLAEAEREWRQDVDVPRNAVAGIEARFRAAREAALQHLGGHEESRWQAHCDALEARLGVGTEGEPTLADADARSKVQESPGGEPESRNAKPCEPALDELLLQLEATLNVSVAPEWQAARRDLKLRALKDTLEGRNPRPANSTQPAEWLATALRQRGLTDVQRERLRAVIAALRQAPPGALRLMAPRDV